MYSYKKLYNLVFILIMSVFVDTGFLNAQQIALEEIVVTARKRDESIQDIPISITAFTAADLQRRNIQEMTDISLFTPGFNFENLGGYGGTAPVVRGATQVAGTVGAEQNVSFFLDGIYLPRSYVTDIGFANIQRIEVVKGPQSARYGRNAFMGAVNYISKRPTDEWSAEGTVTLGNYGRYDGSVSISGALIEDKISILASAHKSKFDGSWKNSHPFADIDYSPGTDDRTGGWDKTAFTGAIEFTPTEEITLNISYRNYELDREHSAQNWFGELNADSQFLNCGAYNPDVRPAGSGLGGGGDWNRLYCGELPVRSIPIDPRGYAQQLDLEVIRASINWQINDEVSFEYIYGRVEADSKALGYKDTLPGCSFFVPLCVFENGPIGDFGADSHEARIAYDGEGNLSGAFGLYYYESSDFITSNFAAALPLSSVPTASVDVLDPSNFVFQVSLRNIASRNNAISPFGEVTLSFAEDSGRIGIEARYTELEKKEDNQASGGGTGGLGAFGGSFLEETYTSFTPRISIEFDLSEDSLVFASAAKGVKSGGFNATATLAKNIAYENDNNWTYEIGTKNTLGDGRMQINASLFLVDWSDAHILAQDEGNPNPLSVSLVRNVGDIRSKGFEMDAALAATENLSFYGTLYYGDAKYREGTFDLRWGRIPSVCDNVVCSTNGDVGGNQMERQSKFQASLGGQWADTLPGNSDMSYFIRADLGHQSKMYADAVNLAEIGPRTVINASTGINGGAFDVQLWVRNLFNKKYIQNVFVQQPNIAYNAYLGERQTFGVTLTARY